MNPSIPLPLTSWQNFYVIVGSSAGALTGLQFVVITLMAQSGRVGGTREIRAFGTPTVTHFCAALLISAIMTAPWPTLAPLGSCFAVVGILGILYSLSIIWHARKANYKPDLEDWIWYTVLPCIAHLAVAATAIPLWYGALWPLIVIATDALLLLLIGVHNSWDTVTYIAARSVRNPKDVRESE